MDAAGGPEVPVIRSSVLVPALATLGLIAACGPSDRADLPFVRDIHSYARPEIARVTHVALDLRADFERRQLSGSATLTLDRARDAAEVVLDTRDLAIEAVTDTAGSALEFVLGTPDSILGRPLRVSLPRDVTVITIRYATSPDAPALQWLDPAQTAGGQQPYLFSQGQAILTRTWVPTQDSPGIRQTYAARLVVPDGLRAVMSAEMLTPDGTAVPGGRAFAFRMPEPIPPYLFALAIGDIAFRATGPRTGVYAEPAVVEQAAAEFADLERMVEATEALYGPYRWGRYDVLVLPPSFPFGGMENPRLTFATPTILAGDRSLVALIAHELAHSWSGNLVTNATWSDFWLNEGFTSYLELRIMEAVYGAERAAMLEVLGRQDLETAIAEFGADSSRTVLHLNLRGHDPDDAATPIAYDKGAALLRTIETSVGRDRFDRWLRDYFARHAFTSITSADFLRDIREHLIAGDQELEDQLQLERWVYGPGLPGNAVVPHSEAFARVDAQVTRFQQGSPARQLSAGRWSTQEWQHFLGALLADSLTREQLADLDRTFGLTRSGNSEVLVAWLRIAIAHRYEPALPALERFLTSQGRRKFLRPLYADLMARAWGQPLARQIYRVARPRYHTVSTRTIDAIVQ